MGCVGWAMTLSNFSQGTGWRGLPSTLLGSSGARERGSKSLLLYWSEIIRPVTVLRALYIMVTVPADKLLNDIVGIWLKVTVVTGRHRSGRGRGEDGGRRQLGRATGALRPALTHHERQGSRANAQSKG